MAKKEKVPLKQTGDLEDIERELDEAMAGLDGANERVSGLLAGIETPAPRSSAEASELDEASEPSQSEAER